MSKHSIHQLYSETPAQRLLKNIKENDNEIKRLFTNETVWETFLAIMLEYRSIEPRNLTYILMTASKCATATAAQYTYLMRNHNMINKAGSFVELSGHYAGWTVDRLNKRRKEKMSNI